MRLVTPDIEINPDEPFKNDKLNRQSFAESLFNLITNVEDNLVISLDAPWGDGKTTFVRMWNYYLKKKEVKSLYFDAFANDSFEDPFMALVGSIDSLIKEEFSETSTTKQKLDEFKSKAVKVGTRLLSWGAKIGVKAVTLNVIDSEQLKCVIEDIASDAGETASKFIEDKLNSYKEVLTATEEFKKKLEELANEAYKINHKPLVFIIDELDRCKPTYALELIEKIKHLFSVKHIVFVLVMHAEQLCESVKCVYGQNIDARTYLHKFINIECKLPKNEKKDPYSAIPENSYAQYCMSLSEVHNLPVKGDWGVLWTPARVFNLSLRDLQRCFTSLTLFFSGISENQYREYYILVLLVILKVKKPNIYESLKSQNISLDELWAALPELELLTSRDENRWKESLRDILTVCMLPDEEFSKLDVNSHAMLIWRSISSRYRIHERSSILSYHYERLESFKFLQEGK